VRAPPLHALLAAPSAREALNFGLPAPPVVHDAQLAACVDSYLRFKARPHDLGAEAVASDQDSALARPVVLLYLRAATPTGDAAAHASLLRRCRLVGVPQLLDFAALFGPSNTQLVARVFTGLLAAAPWLREGIAAAGAAAAENLLQLAQRCADVCEAPSDGDSLREVLDAAIYFADCGATFAALVTCCPAAASDLLSGDGASLLHSLAVVYDNALEALSHADFGPQSPAFQAAVTRAQAAVARATWALLRAAFLDPGAGTAASRREALTLSVLSMSSAEAGGGRLLSRLGGCHDIAAVLADAQLGLDATQRAQLLASFAHNAGPARDAAPAGNDAQLQSRIAAVRDVLPDYGDGFVAACLDALGQDAERVMAALLDGSLPAAVAGLDTRLTLTAYRGAAGPSRREQPPRSGRPVPKPRVPAPVPAAAGYRKHAQRYAWQRDEALELLETRDADVINAARLAAVAAECEAGTDAADAEGAWPRSLQPLGASNEYDDDFDDEDDSQWGVPAPRLASDDDAEAGGGATAGEAAVPTTSAGSRKFWLFEGRVYTYAKPGATLVQAASAEAAHAIGQAAAAAEKAQIHGLGEGGNRAAPGPAAAPREAGGRGDGGEGGRGDGGGPGRGRGRGSFARKEQNKGAVGNHHRRDRAAAKQRVLLGSGGT
jgi:activating signal cointegrator complex subunit 2